MLTVGIDLSAQDTRTAGCLLEWEAGGAKVIELRTGLSDSQLLELMRRGDKVGIDAPLGWPLEFVEAVYSWSRMREWPGVPRARLRYRETDRFVAEHPRVHRWPLSVSSDWIAVVAMRCAELLRALERTGELIDRTGGRKVAEVYPAAALAVWGFEPGAYKRVEGAGARQVLVAALVERAPWLELANDVRAACELSDDAIDALVSSFVARCVALGLTEPPATAEQAELARHEGWIHLPAEGSFERLAG